MHIVGATAGCDPPSLSLGWCKAPWMVPLTTAGVVVDSRPLEWGPPQATGGWDSYRVASWEGKT